MEPLHLHQGDCCCCRREFLQTVGAAGALAMLSGGSTHAAAPGEAAPRKKGVATIRGAFLYPPSETLKKEGYWSWPGSTFDAEGRQRQYLDKLGQIERNPGVRVAMDAKPLDTADDAARFIAGLKQSKPDGLLLIPFKKGHWAQVVRIVEEAKIPTVILASLGVLLVDQINTLRRKPGVYLISSGDNLDAVSSGLKMIKTLRWMKDARIVNIAGSQTAEVTLPDLGTQVRSIPHARFVEQYQRMEATPAVRQLAEAYRKNAKEIVEPVAADILDAARCYFVLKQIIQAEQADAMMMNCLTGLRLPHQHCPPCMGFMSLRDEGIPAGCQSDLSSTLTLMLVQQLFDKPGFQQNASMETEKNLYFGSHCTSASKMKGFAAPPEPYVLRSHAEAGWGCVPRVLFSPGQEVTMAQYLSGKQPQMIVYTGKVAGCPPIPPTGGCRTNVEMSVNEVADVCDVKGMHQIIFYGNHGKQLRAFCQLCGIAVVT